MVRWFAQWARRQSIDDATLRVAIEDIRRGLFDADLGGGLVKKRIARRGKGKSSGYRIIIAMRIDQRAFFLYGFAKNDKANLNPGELANFKKVAGSLLQNADPYIDELIDLGEMVEVK